MRQGDGHSKRQGLIALLVFFIVTGRSVKASMRRSLKVSTAVSQHNFAPCRLDSQIFNLPTGSISDDTQDRAQPCNTQYQVSGTR